jgi:hypothetical protein
VECATRAKLWQQYVASYRRVLDESPEAFSEFLPGFATGSFEPRQTIDQQTFQVGIGFRNPGFRDGCKSFRISVAQSVN